MGTLATNYPGRVNKWFPYYYKPFRLGEEDSGTVSDDNSIYITKTAGSGSSKIRAICSDAYNCTYYYKLEFSSSTLFLVKKYDSNDKLVDTLYASGSGTDKWTIYANGWLTIDIGVWILGNGTSFANDDRYTITLSSFDVMERRKIYPGGYTSYVRMPETEGKSYHTNIIPTTLKDRNITVYFGFLASKDLTIGGLTSVGVTALSSEDPFGNSAVTLALEWNINPDSDNSDAATAIGSDDTDAYAWGSGETWQLGKVFAEDVSTRDFADIPVLAQGVAGNISPPAGAVTGTYQKYNATCVGIAGHAKITSQYQDGPGSPTIIANNQFWPVTLLIN